MGKPAFLKYIVIILPLIFLWAGLHFDRKNFPNDPEYIYLMNALCICDGQSVGHVDNPGTTVMQLGAATIGIIHLFSNPNDENVVEHVLKNPNKFIEGIRKAMVILNSIFLFFLGWFVFKKTRSVWIALFMQVSMFLSEYVLETIWVKLSPESFLFLITGIYTILVLYYYLERDRNQWKYVIYFGLITGAGLATKATFLPLVIFPLFVLPSLKKKLFYFIAIVPAFVLFTIPAIPEYNRMFFWFRDLISHSGIYGNGEKAIIDTKTYMPNVQNIIFNNPIIPVVLGAGIVALAAGYFFRKKYHIIRDLKFLAGLLSSFVFGTLLVAKHYGGNHYLLPVILLNGVTLFVTIDIIIHIGNSKILKTLLLPVSVVVCVVFITWNHPQKLIVANRQLKAASNEIDAANLWLEKNYPSYTPINYYIYSINKFTGLKFGNDFARGKLLSHLRKIYPKTYFYELSTDLYFHWKLKTTLDQIVETSGKKIILMNGPTDPSQIKEMENLGFPLKQVYKGQSQNIYILDTLKYTPPPKQNLKQTGATIHFNVEQFTGDGKFFLASNSEVFGPVNALSSEEYRSGSHSVKLQKPNPFAVDYNLKNTKTGEIYEIEVWRKSDSSSGYLVVSADNSNDYYQAQNEAVKFGENGWELLRIKVEIKPAIEGKNLKIYLWNPRRRVAWFDDLSIKKFTTVSPENK